MRLSALTTTFVVLAGVQFSGTAAFAADPAEWVPADALVFFGAEDVEQLAENFKKTAGYKSMVDKELTEMPGVVDWKSLSEKLQKRLGELLEQKPEQLENPFGGPLVMYIVAPQGGKSEDANVVIAAGVRKQTVMREYLDVLVNRLKEAADEYDKRSLDGSDLHIFKTREQEETTDDAADEFDFDEEADSASIIEESITELFDELFALEDLPEELALWYSRDRLFVSSSADQLREAASRRGGRDALERTDDYRLMLDKLAPVGQFRFAINIPRIVELAETGEGNPEQTRATLKTLGVRSLRSIVGHMRMGTDAYDSKMDVLVLMESSRSGLAEILTMANRPVAPPRWIPATTALFMSLNLDPPKLMDQTLRMMAQQDPETAQSIEMQLRQGPPGPDGQPMNLREALINRLTGPLVGLVSFREPYDANSMQALLALGHSNQQGLTSLITMLMSMVGGATPRDFQGTQIYANPMAGSVALTPDQLYWGNAPAVEGAVSAGQSGGGLMEKDDFRNAARLVPDEAWLVTYIDAREVLRAMAHLGDKVRSGQIPPDSLAGQLMFMMQMSGQETPKPDEIDKMMKYTAAQIMTISTTSDGLRMTAVTLNPPKSEGGSAN